MLLKLQLPNPFTMLTLSYSKFLLLLCMVNLSRCYLLFVVSNALVQVLSFLVNDICSALFAPCDACIVFHYLFRHFSVVCSVRECNDFQVLRSCCLVISLPFFSLNTCEEWKLSMYHASKLNPHKLNVFVLFLEL